MTKTKISDAEALERFEDFDPQAATVRDRTAVADIEQAVHARKVAEEATEEAVRRARQDGITWTEIASALGVSHQAAMKRYRDKVATADQATAPRKKTSTGKTYGGRKATPLSKGTSTRKSALTGRYVPATKRPLPPR